MDITSKLFTEISNKQMDITGKLFTEFLFKKKWSIKKHGLIFLIWYKVKSLKAF